MKNILPIVAFVAAFNAGYLSAGAAWWTHVLLLMLSALVFTGAWQWASFYWEPTWDDIDGIEGDD